jgi:hypothetical protein
LNTSSSLCHGICCSTKRGSSDVITTTNVNSEGKIECIPWPDLLLRSRVRSQRPVISPAGYLNYSTMRSPSCSARSREPCVHRTLERTPPTTTAGPLSTSRPTMNPHVHGIHLLMQFVIIQGSHTLGVTNHRFRGGGWKPSERGHSHE